MASGPSRSPVLTLPPDHGKQFFDGCPGRRRRSRRVRPMLRLTRGCASGGERRRRSARQVPRVVHPGPGWKGPIRSAARVALPAGRSARTGRIRPHPSGRSASSAVTDKLQNVQATVYVPRHRSKDHCTCPSTGPGSPRGSSSPAAHPLPPPAEHSPTRPDQDHVEVPDTTGRSTTPTTSNKIIRADHRRTVDPGSEMYRPSSNFPRLSSRH